MINDDLQQQIRTHFDPKLEFSSEKFYLWRFKQKDEIHTICIVLEQKKMDLIFYYYRHPSANAFFVADRKPRYVKFALCESYYSQKKLSNKN